MQARARATANPLPLFLIPLTVILCLFSVYVLLWISSKGQNIAPVTATFITLICVASLVIGVRAKGQQWFGSKSLSFFSLLLGIVFWALLQLFHSINLLDSELRAFGYQFKNYLGAGVVAALILYAIHKIISSQSILKINQIVMLFLALVFPIYASVSMLCRDDNNFPLMGMYFLWSLYGFVVLPIIFNNLQSWTAMLRLIWVTTALSLVVGILWGFMQAQVYWSWTNRVAFVFGLVPYSHALAILALTSLALLIQPSSRALRVIAILTFCAAFALSILAVTRSTIVFIIVTSIVFWVGKNRNWQGGLLVSFIVIPMLIASTIGLFSSGEIDNWSSGRLRLFSHEISEHLADRGSTEWLFGSNTFLRGERTLVVDQVGSESRLERNVTDSTYLAILLAHGIVGLLLFALPLVHAFYLMLAREKQYAGVNKRLVQLGVATLIGLGAQSMFTMTIPSMGNMISIYLPIFWLPLVTMQSPTQKPREGL